MCEEQEEMIECEQCEYEYSKDEMETGKRVICKCCQHYNEHIDWQRI